MRLKRVAELLKREIGEAIRREIPVSEGGVISVNNVVVSGDLRQATVYTSVFGNADQKRRGLSLLEQHRPRIQDMMAKAVILKYTPVLKFVLDDSVERGDRVLQILDQLEQADSSKTA